MKPPTPAMIRALRHIEWRANEAHFVVIGDFCHHRIMEGLKLRGLIELIDLPIGVRQWHLTDAGRRVLAEHPTTGEAQ